MKRRYNADSKFLGKISLRRGEKYCMLHWTNLCIDFCKQSPSRSTTNACLYLVLGFKELSVFPYPDNSHLCSGLGCSRVIHYFCLCCSCFSLWCQLCSSLSASHSHVCKQNHSDPTAWWQWAGSRWHVALLQLQKCMYESWQWNACSHRESSIVI